MEKRVRKIEVNELKKSDEMKTDEQRLIELAKPEKTYKDCSYKTTLPKNWVNQNYREELEKYDKCQILRGSVKQAPHNKETREKMEQAEKEWERTKMESLKVDVNRWANFLVISTLKRKLCSSSPVPIVEIQEIRNSLELTNDVDKKAELFYNWLVAKFVAGYDSVSFQELYLAKDFVRKCIEPFLSTGLASPLNNKAAYGLDFVSPQSSKMTIRELFEIIMTNLKEIDEKVRQGLSHYCEHSDINSLQKYFEGDLKTDDKEIELSMWAVIRKVSRQLGFCEPKEELAHNIFYTVLAADAKLLERYKDNYVDIGQALIKHSLPSNYCSEISDIIQKTHRLLDRSVDVLLEAAYIKEEDYARNRNNIMEKVDDIWREYCEINVAIDEAEVKVLANLAKAEIDDVVKGKQIWEFSRIFDKLHRRNKRVFNIAQSAIFGLPYVEFH